MRVIDVDFEVDVARYAKNHAIIVARARKSRVSPGNNQHKYMIPGPQHLHEPEPEMKLVPVPVPVLKESTVQSKVCASSTNKKNKEIATLFLQQVLEMLKQERVLISRGQNVEVWPGPSLCACLSDTHLQAIDFLRVQLRVNPNFVLGSLSTFKKC